MDTVVPEHRQADDRPANGVALLGRLIPRLCVQTTALHQANPVRRPML
jgi:hypothetical protein